MSTAATPPAIVGPARRRLRIYAFDPLTTRLTRRMLTVSVPNEPLGPGPTGRLVQVVDTDVSGAAWFHPIDLDQPEVIAQDGLRPTEHDPRSHQQVVYAVASSVLERTERALGRRLRWRKNAPLVLMPHAFRRANARFDPESFAIHFGYFTAGAKESGRNLPGQTIFTCLSVDVVVHEVTHAVLHDIRRNLIVSTSPDGHAIHEAIADIVALLHHFVFRDVVRDAIAEARGNIRSSAALLDLASEFGEALGRSGPLRTALLGRTGGTSPDPAAKGGLPSGADAYDRGALVVQSVFSAFLATFESRIADLLRIATGGTGELPPGSLHPDLVGRVADEATDHAERMLRIVLRSVDYLPVVDATFGDLVRAIVTADRHLFPSDGAGIRSALVEAFRQRRVHPDGIRSLADESLVWPTMSVATGAEGRTGPLRLDADALDDLNRYAVRALRHLDLKHWEDVDGTSEVKRHEDDASFRYLLAWVRAHAEYFGFEPKKSLGRFTQVSVTVSVRDNEDRQPIPVTVLQLTQRRIDLETPAMRAAGFELRAGAAIFFRQDGTVHHVISTPLPFAEVRDEPTRSDSYRTMVQDHHQKGLMRVESIKERLADPLVAPMLTDPALAFAELDDVPPADLPASPQVVPGDSLPAGDVA